jgi:uncharacterized protein (TIGR03083 family)
MNRDELLKSLAASRAELDAALAGLAEAQMTEPGVMGDWTLKDVLAHLTAWEVELVTVLGKLARGQTPKPAGQTDAETDALNAKWYRDYKNRPLDRVLADYHAVRPQTIRQVERLTVSDLTAPRKWLKGGTLHDMILSETIEHDAEHLPHIREWRKAKGY